MALTSKITCISLWMQTIITSRLLNFNCTFVDAGDKEAGLVIIVNKKDVINKNNKNHKEREFYSGHNITEFRY